MPTVAKTKASGTARPTRPTVPCGLMLAAIDGAIRATEMPIASQMERLPPRRPCEWLAEVGASAASAIVVPPAGVAGRHHGTGELRTRDAVQHGRPQNSASNDVMRRAFPARRCARVPAHL